MPSKKYHPVYAKYRERTLAQKAKRYREDAAFREKILNKSLARYAENKDNPEFKAAKKAYLRKYYLKRKGYFLKKSKEQYVKKKAAEQAQEA